MCYAQPKTREREHEQNEKKGCCSDTERFCLIFFGLLIEQTAQKNLVERILRALVIIKLFYCSAIKLEDTPDSKRPKLELEDESQKKEQTKNLKLQNDRLFKFRDELKREMKKQILKSYYNIMHKTQDKYLVILKSFWIKQRIY